MHSTGIASLDNLINAFSGLPGIGQKTAQRLAMFILKKEPEYAQELAGALTDVKTRVGFCKQCFNISEQELCPVCMDKRRDQGKICVVEDVVDIMAIESTNEYNGLYHVLGGVISPLQGIMPADLHIKELLERAGREEVKELLMAINPSTEGEATMIYVSKMLHDTGVRITRIASGVPLGSHLEFLDSATIGRAILARRDL